MTAVIVLKFNMAVNGKINSVLSVCPNQTEAVLTQLGSLCRLLRIIDVCKMRHRVAEHCVRF